MGLGSGRGEIWGWDQGEMRDLGLGPGRDDRFGAWTRERWEIWGWDQREMRYFGLEPERGERFGTGTKERWEI